MSLSELGHCAHELMKDGMTIHEIAAQLGVSIKSIYRWLTRARAEGDRPQPGCPPDVAGRLARDRASLHRYQRAARPEDRPARPTPMSAGKLPKPLPWWPPECVCFTPQSRCDCDVVGCPRLPFVCLVCHKSEFDPFLYRSKDPRAAESRSRFKPHAKAKVKRLATAEA